MLEELRQRARRVGEADGPALFALDETEGALRALGALAKEGLCAWTVPRGCGGADSGGLVSGDRVSVRALSVLRDELAWHSGMLDVMLVMQGLGSYPLAVYGTEEQRGPVLERVARGECIAAFALTEPGAGSSLNDVATRAERTASGWRLDGHKTFISNAGIADHYTLLARTEGAPGDRGGLSMFHFSGDTPGLRVERFEVMGPHPIGDLYLEGMELPEDALLGEAGAGLEMALGNLGRFRTSVAAAANGFARRALDESRGRLSQRAQFGRPLASFQGLRFDLAEMDTRLRAAQLLVEEAAHAVDAEEEAGLAVARAKLFATETAGWICDRAVQHFGGLGVKRGSVVEHLYRDVRALRIYEGTSEIQKAIIAKAVLER